MSPQDNGSKEWRRKALLRKKLDREKRINPIAKDVRHPKYRQRVEELKNKINTRSIDEETFDD
jgi:hypothetical protein